MPLSHEEIQREKVLNKELKLFGLSLDSTVQDVYQLSLNPVKGKKQIPDKLTSLGGRPMPLQQYIDEVRQSTLYDPEKTINKLLSDVTKKQNRFDVITSIAYEKADDNISLHSFEMLFLKDFITSPVNTTSEYIEMCLASIVYGVEVAYLIAGIKNGDNTAKNKKKRVEGKPSTLKEIFTSDKEYKEAIAALQEVNTPVIDKNMNYLLGERQKSAFTAWVDVLRFKGKLLHVGIPDISDLLNNEIKGLSVNEKTLRTPKKSLHRNTAYSKYYSALMKKIPA